MSKLPKRFYTVEQLAERWECPPPVISTLIREGRLKSVPLLAAVHDQHDVRIDLTQDPAARPGIQEAYPGEWFVPVYHPDRPDNTATPEQALEHTYAAMYEQGDYLPVVLLSDVERFEREYDIGQGPGSEKRGPKPGPRDVNVYRVIAGLALANGYRPGSKQAQGWRNKIIRELDKKGIPLDPDKLTDVIKYAFDKLKIN